MGYLEIMITHYYLRKRPQKIKANEQSQVGGNRHAGIVFHQEG